MDIIITPTQLEGSLRAIPSKSQAHRFLICAAFSDNPTTLLCPETNQDIEATAGCLCALGADISRTDQGYFIIPSNEIPAQATLNCAESGSTLRFMLPIVGALGVDTTFQMEGRLPSRPLSPLWEEMERMGCHLSRPSGNTLRSTGRLKAGVYSIDGGVSSQFITGLLFAHSLMDGRSSLTISGNLESKPYIQMTQDALSLFKTNPNSTSPFHSPGTVTVEGDWSNAAFFLGAKAIGCNVAVSGLDPASSQGDRACDHLFKELKNAFLTIDASDIPDLVPILSVVAASNHGARFTNIRRLRMKESDRVEAVCSMLKALGVRTVATEHELSIFPAHFTGGTVDSFRDHRIAMAAAIAAVRAKEPVIILKAECVSKSYPGFWKEYQKLGGNYEQYLR